jgi:hypothetical protein
MLVVENGFTKNDQVLNFLAVQNVYVANYPFGLGVQRNGNSATLCKAINGLYL